MEDVSWIWQPGFLKKALSGIVVCIVAVYIATLPFFTKPLYESEVIMYAPLTLMSQQLKQQGVGFADDKEIDWYIQILKSSRLKDSLVSRFKLNTFFRIDTGKAAAKNKLFHILEQRIDVEKTRYGSVSVKARDTDPDRAAALANGIVNIGESIRTAVLYPNRLDAMNYARNLFEQRAWEIGALQKKLDSLQKYSRSPQGKGDLLCMETLEMYNLELKEFALRKDMYEREKSEFDTPLPKAYIISPGLSNPNPVWPNRWLLCILSAGIYLFLLIAINIIKRDHRRESQKK